MWRRIPEQFQPETSAKMFGNWVADLDMGWSRIIMQLEIVSKMNSIISDRYLEGSTSTLAV
jgi:hypothetical protein